MISYNMNKTPQIISYKMLKAPQITRNVPHIDHIMSVKICLLNFCVFINIFIIFSEHFKKNKK